MSSPLSSPWPLSYRYDKHANHYTAAFFIHQQEQKIYHFALVALDCGLGKTLTTLVFIISSTRERARHNALHPDKTKKFKATLVLCPADTIEVWHQNIEKFFPKKPLKIYQFYGTPKTVPASRLSNLISTINELNIFLKDLDPLNPQVSLSYRYDKSSRELTSQQTGNTIIITAYTTWWNRTLATIEADRVVLFYNSADGTASGEELPVGRVWTSQCGYEFERKVCDESHTLRNPQTLLSEGVKQTRSVNLIYLSATPILNHCREIGGILTQIWDLAWELYNVDTSFINSYHDDFDPASYEHKDGAKTKTISLIPPDNDEYRLAHQAYQAALESEVKVWLLDPDNYRTCGSQHQ